MDASEKKPGRPVRALSDKAQLFVAEYLKDFNAAKAALRAGYSAQSARYQGSKMLRNVAIADAIRKGRDKMLQSCEISFEHIVRQLAAVAFFDPARLFDESGNLRPIHEMPPEVRQGLPGMEVSESRTSGAGAANTVVRRVRMGGRIQAILALAKHLTVFAYHVANDPNNLSVPDLNADEADPPADNAADASNGNEHFKVVYDEPKE